MGGYGWIKEAIRSLKHRRLFLLVAALDILLFFAALTSAALAVLNGSGFLLPIVLLLISLAAAVNLFCMTEGIFRPYYYITSEKESSFSNSFADELLFIISNHYSHKERTNSYQILQKQAQISALQQQINPHFLYNALDSVRGLAYTEKATKTADMVEALAVFFRYTIGGKDDMVSLNDELQGIHNYLKIQQYRYKTPASIRYQVEMSDSNVLKTLIPRLTLQPIVENAIKHGFLHTDENKTILIKLIPTQSRLLISIIDNGIGISDQALVELNDKLNNNSSVGLNLLKERSNGIALQNINARIQLHFGSEYGLTIFSTTGIGTEVQIAIPLIWERTENDRDT